MTGFWTAHAFLLLLLVNFLPRLLDWLAVNLLTKKAKAGPKTGAPTQKAISANFSSLKEKAHRPKNEAEEAKWGHRRGKSSSQFCSHQQNQQPT